MVNETESNHLDKTEVWHTLEKFTREYLAARGKDNVAQVAINRENFKTGTLTIIAHTSVQGELPDIVTETDAITLHGQRYDFYFDEDPYGPQDLGRITLYAADDIRGMDEVPLEDGLAAVEDHMQELLEREEAIPSRTED